MSQLTERNEILLDGSECRVSRQKRMEYARRQEPQLRCRARKDSVNRSKNNFYSTVLQRQIGVKCLRYKAHGGARASIWVFTRS